MKYFLLLLLCLPALVVTGQIERTYGLRVGGLVTQFHYNSTVFNYARVEGPPMESIVQPLLHVFRCGPWGQRFGWQLEAGYTGGGFQVRDPLKRDHPSRVVLNQFQLSTVGLYQYGEVLGGKQYLLLGMTYSYTALLTVRQSRYMLPVDLNRHNRDPHFPWIEAGLGGVFSDASSLGWEFRYTQEFWRPTYIQATYQFSLTMKF